MIKKAVLVGGLAVFATILMWLPFWLRLDHLLAWNLDFKSGMTEVWRNFDGPNYLIIAKTWYNKEAIRVNFSNPLPLEYYPAHLPFYPLTIAALNKVVSGPWAMLLSTLLANFLLFTVFYLYLTHFKIEQKAIWLSLLLLFLPARGLAVRAVGSPESWFMLFILLSIWKFKEKKYFLAAIFGVLAQLTKSPGILLFAAYGLVLVWESLKAKKLNLKSWLAAAPLLLIPISAVGLFYFYKIRIGDFWAYFHSGDNFHLFWPPFSIFTPEGKFWTGDFWLEEVIWLWLIYGIGIINLWKEKFETEAVFASVFFATTLFIAHRDIARYILPISPLILIGWRQTILKKEYLALAIILAIPCFLFAWQFLLNNQAPIADWAPYL